MPVESPCNAICKLDVKGHHCIGCRRTIDEIARWGQGSDAWKREVIAQLPARSISAG